MSELLEREALLSVLNGLGRAAAEGHGHTVLVSGEAGIGKTALLERFAAEFGLGRVLWGGCEALTPPRPLGPLHDIARCASARLRTCLSAGVDRTAVFGAVLDELAYDPAPTIVVFEAIHWADEATLALIKFIGRRIQRVPALLLLSHRDDVTSIERLRRLLGELPSAHVSRLTVPALTRSAVERLATSAQRDASGIHAVSGGNSFFVAELLRQGHDGGVPASVRDAVLGRAAQLSASPLEVLHLVAVVPRQVQPALADALFGDAGEAVEACSSSGLLVEEARALRFRHELSHTAVESSTPAPRTALLHRRVLVGFEDRFEHQHRCCHAHPIAQGRDAQRPEFAVGFRYEHASDGVRSILLIPERKRQFAEPPLHAIRVDIREVLTVHARWALVGAALGPGMGQDVIAQLTPSGLTGSRSTAAGGAHPQLDAARKFALVLPGGADVGPQPQGAFLRK